MRVLVFGASTVQGFWDSQGGWVERLKRHYDEIQLRDLSADIPHVMNLGVSGDGSAELLKRIDAEAKARQNAKGLSILISIGTNSAAILDGKPVASAEKFIDELKQIINIAKKHTDKIMLVGLPAVDEARATPVAWINLHFQNARIAQFETAMKNLADEQGIPFVPVHADMAKKSNLQSSDGLHPNDAGHQLIFEVVRPELDKLLK